MPIDYNLLTYDTIVDGDKVLAALDSENPNQNQLDTFHSLDIVQDKFYTFVQPRRMRYGYASIGKFHLSIAEEDLGRAWNAIIHRMAREDLAVKVMRPAGLERVRGTQAGSRGKSIVIYFDTEQARDRPKFDALLNDIEGIFKRENIQAGAEIEGGTRVPGSSFSYLSYGDTRYDRETGRPIPSDVPRPRTPLDDIVVGQGKWAGRIADKEPPRRDTPG